MVYKFYLGNVEVTTQNINELREYVEEIQTKIGDGEELCKHLSDFCFDVEATYQRHHNISTSPQHINVTTTYQRHHNLDQDNWDMVH